MDGGEDIRPENADIAIVVVPKSVRTVVIWVYFGSFQDLGGFFLDDGVEVVVGDCRNDAFISIDGALQYDFQV